MVTTPNVAGTWNTKRGKVLLVLRGGMSARDALKKAGETPQKLSHFTGSDRSLNDRYLVKVERKEKAPLYYAPVVATIDGDSRSAGRKVGR